MGHILDKIHQIVEDGDRKKNQSNETETGEETNEEPMATHNDVTNHENPLEATVTEDEDEEDPYRERIVGKTKRVQERENQKPLYHKKKCAYCGKGFNSKSTFKMCHLCDKIQHKSCIETHLLDNTRFAWLNVSCFSSRWFLIHVSVQSIPLNSVSRDLVNTC